MDTISQLEFIKVIFPNLLERDHQTCAELLLKFGLKNNFKQVEEKNYLIDISIIPKEAISSLYNLIINILRNKNKKT
jgi:hypothetical protein